MTGAGGTSDLGGRRIAVTRAASQAGPLIEAIVAAKGVPVPVPLLKIEADPGGVARLGRALLTAGREDWVAVTSPNGARHVGSAAAGNSLPPRCRLAAIGETTARAAQSAGWPADLVSPEPTAAGLARALIAAHPVGLVIVANSELARPTLVDDLRAAGCRVERTIVYRNVCPPIAPEASAAAASVDAVTFASPTAVDRWVANVDRRPMAACIGDVTAAAAREAGFDVRIASTADAAGLVRALLSS